MIRRLRILAFVLILIGSNSISSPFLFALSGSDFRASRIIDDSKFFVGPTMSVSDIQNFLNAKVPVCDTWGEKPYGGTTRAAYSASSGYPAPFTCLKESRDTITSKIAESGLCNGISPGSGTAAEIIYWVSASCNINPQVLIVLLQKEQALVTDDWPWPIQYRSATGYGCPDTALCNAQYFGFFNQVYNAARQFKLYARNPGAYNYGANRTSYIGYNPNSSCGGTNVYVENAATAALYNYTPYQPNASALANLYGSGDSCGAYGNRNFWRLFNDWFGSTLGPMDYSCGSQGANITGADGGNKIIANKRGSGPELLTSTMPNQTSSGCIELHTWTTSYQSWFEHKATNRPSINPANAEIISADTDGNGRDELLVVESRDTNSGRVEFHVWDDSYQKWIGHIASVHPSVDPADSDILAADTNGDGRDELFLVKYRGTTSGRIEVHGWTANTQGWVSHTATNHPVVDPAGSRIITADSDGDGKDEFYLVQYTGTTSGRIEVHGWMPNLQQWFLHTATSHYSIDPGTGMVTPADINGDGRDEFLLVMYRNTGSGRIEVHGWMPNLQQWFLHTATAP